MYTLLLLAKTNNKTNKFQVDLLNTETNKIKSIKFGRFGMEDYTTYTRNEGKKIADAHKKRYLDRHRKREDWTKSGIATAGFWSRWLLWNKGTLEKSFQQILKKFNLN